METETIHRDGKDYPAVRCPRCRGKVHPVDKLELHMALHMVRDLECRPNNVQRVFARATRGKWW